MIDQMLEQFSWLGDVYFQLLCLLLTLLILKYGGRCHPSRLCFIVLGLPLLLYAASNASFNTAWLSWVFIPVFCSVLLIDRFVLSVSPRQLSVTRKHSKKFSIQNANDVGLVLENKSPHPIKGQVLDDYPGDFNIRPDQFLPLALEPLKTATLTYAAYPSKRGPYRFRKTHLRYQSGLGLLWLNATLGEESNVDVFPDLKRIRKLRVQFSKAFALGELQKRKLGAEGTQFDSLRNYFNGDDVRKIAWAATARLDTPIIRVHTHEVEQPIVVLIDAGRKMLGAVSLTPSSGRLDENEINVSSKFDYALNAALAFTTVALERGDEVAVRVFHQDTLAYVPIGRGQKQFHRIMVALAHVEPQPLEPDYETALLETDRTLTKRSVIVLFTDLIDPLTSKTLVNSLISLAKHHVVIVATWQDEVLVASSHKIPQTVEESYQQGVRLDLLDVRRRTLKELSSHGNISVIDATPETLDEQLLNHYVSAKLRNRF